MRVDFMSNRQGVPALNDLDVDLHAAINHLTDESKSIDVRLHLLEDFRDRLRRRIEYNKEQVSTLESGVKAIEAKLRIDAYEDKTHGKAGNATAPSHMLDSLARDRPEFMAISRGLAIAKGEEARLRKLDRDFELYMDIWRTDQATKRASYNL